jgi:hypothetical protein
MDDEFPHGARDELRDIAIETARRALNEAGYDVELGSSLPADLVAIIEKHDLPLSTLVSYVHFLPRGREVTPESFAKHCLTFRNDAAKLDYGGYAEPGLCPQCHAYPTQRVGSFLVCASGRCAPVVVG